MQRYLTINSRRVPFSGSEEQWQQLRAGQRAQSGMRRGALMQARRAHGPGKIKAVIDFMLMLSSETRISQLVPLIEHEPAETFWPIFADVWPMCDRTYGWNDRLLAALRRLGPHPSVEELPESLTVYRGCTRARIAALSWTTALETARGFARGHRHIVVPNPCVAMAQIDRSAVFWHTDDRNEHEVLCWPSRWSIIE